MHIDWSSPVHVAALLFIGFCVACAATGILTALGTLLEVIEYEIKQFFKAPKAKR